MHRACARRTARHTSQTKHQALPKRPPGRRITPNNTAAVHVSAQQQPTIIIHTRQGHHQILSTRAARCEAQEQFRRAEPHITIDTTRLSGDTQRPPPLLPSSGVADGQPRAHSVLLSKGRGRGRGGRGGGMNDEGAGRRRRRGANEPTSDGAREHVTSALRTQGPERAASADPGARKAVTVSWFLSFCRLTERYAESLIPGSASKSRRGRPVPWR